MLLSYMIYMYQKEWIFFPEGVVKWFEHFEIKVKKGQIRKTVFNLSFHAHLHLA